MSNAALRSHKRTPVINLFTVFSASYILQFFKILWITMQKTTIYQKECHSLQWYHCLFLFSFFVFSFFYIFIKFVRAFLYFYYFFCFLSFFIFWSKMNERFDIMRRTFTSKKMKRKWVMKNKIIIIKEKSEVIETSRTDIFWIK